MHLQMRIIHVSTRQHTCNKLLLPLTKNQQQPISRPQSFDAASCAADDSGTATAAGVAGGPCTLHRSSMNLPVGLLRSTCINQHKTLVMLKANANPLVITMQQTTMTRAQFSCYIARGNGDCSSFLPAGYQARGQWPECYGCVVAVTTGKPKYLV